MKSGPSMGTHAHNVLYMLFFYSTFVPVRLWVLATVALVCTPPLMRQEMGPLPSPGSDALPMRESTKFFQLPRALMAVAPLALFPVEACTRQLLVVPSCNRRTSSGSRRPPAAFL